MSDKSGGGAPFEGLGLGTQVGSALVDETKQAAASAKQQLGLGAKKQVPKTLPQARQIQEIENNQVEKQRKATQRQEESQEAAIAQMESSHDKKDQDDIKRLSQEIQQIIQEHQAEPKRWEEEMIMHEEQEKEMKKRQEEEEKLQKEKDEAEQGNQQVILPGSKNQPTTPLSVDIAEKKRETGKNIISG